MIFAAVVAAVLLMPATAVRGEQATRPATAQSASAPAMTGSVSRTAQPGVDAAAVRLPPETLNPAIEPAELETRLVPSTRPELAELAVRWQAIVKAKSEEVVAAQIALARSEGSAVSIWSAGDAAADAVAVSLADGEAGNSRLGEIVLVGSDYDTGLFAAALTNGILDVTDRISVYLSGIDRALAYSNFLFGRERLGEILDRDMPEHIRALLRQRDDLVLIEVTDAENAGARNGHAYFRASPWVSSDILATLAYGLGPSERGLVRADPAVPIWSYPSDFIQRLRAGLAAGAQSR